MPKWSKPSTFIKNCITDSYNEEELCILAGDDVQQAVESWAKALFEEGYIELDRSKWTRKDYGKIQQAATARVLELVEEEVEDELND